MLIERGDVIELGEPHEIALAYNELNFGRLRARRWRRGRPLRRPRDGRDQGDAWFEDDAGERITDAGAGRAVHDLRWRCASTQPMEDPIFAFHAAQRAAPHRVRDLDATGAASRSGSFAAGDDVARARALRELARAEPLHGQPVGRARRRRAPTRSTCARTSRRSSCTARASPAAIADVPHTFAVERA